MRKFLSFLLIVFCFSFTGCPQQEPITPPRPTPIVQDTDHCLPAQVHLQQLKCIPEGPFTKKGKTFAEVCEETQAAGVYFNPVCLENVKTCQEIDVCTNSK